MVYNSYWVLPKRLLAGEYPGMPDEFETRRRLRWLLSQGVSKIIDLTEAGEYGLPPYEKLLESEAAGKRKPVAYIRMSIQDFGIPTPDQMRQILDNLFAALQAGEIVYLHCYGGIGRTGTVVGCYLREQGMDGQAALKKIARLRLNLPNSWRRSPETDEQRFMVINWKE